MAQVMKRCSCPRTKWSKCEHSWTVRYWTDGGTRQREKSFKRNYKLANDFARTIEADKLSIHHGDPAPPITFRDYADLWLATKPGSAGTVKIYESVLRVHLTPALGHRKLADVAADRESVTKLLKSLSAGVQKPSYTALSAMLSEAERSGRIKTNRLRAIRLNPPPPQRKLYFATHGELAALAERLSKDLAPAVWIMRGTGIRPGECLALRKSDFVNGHLRVSRQQTRADHSAPLKARKPGDYRDVPCPAYVREIVDKMPDGPLFGVTDTRIFNHRFRRAADARPAASCAASAHEMPDRQRIAGPWPPAVAVQARGALATAVPWPEPRRGAASRAAPNGQVPLARLRERDRAVAGVPGDDHLARCPWVPGLTLLQGRSTTPAAAHWHDLEHAVGKGLSSACESRCLQLCRVHPATRWRSRSRQSCGARASPRPISCPNTMSGTAGMSTSGGNRDGT